MQPGGPWRIALAILAGALTSPVLVVVMGFAVALSQPGGEEVDPIGGVIGAPWLLITIVQFCVAGLIVGSPIALVAILVLFGPLWILHAKRRGRAWSFIALAAAAGLPLSGFWLIMQSGKASLLSLAVAPAAAALASVVMWRVAYDGRRTKADAVTQALIAQLAAIKSD
jgi:hypothetical protein